MMMSLLRCGNAAQSLRLLAVALIAAVLFQQFAMLLLHHKLEDQFHPIQSHLKSFTKGHELKKSSSNADDKLPRDKGRGTDLGLPSDAAGTTRSATLLDHVAEKYGFAQSSKAVQLLRKISLPVYSEEDDLVYFYHPPKTGGTSVSLVLEKLGGVVPTSHAYGWFQRSEMKRLQAEDLISKNQTQETWWKSKRVLYTHTTLTEQYQGQSRPFHGWLESEISNHKQIKYATMIRDPVDRMMSAFHDYVCEMEIRLHHRAKRKGIKITRDNPCLHPMNLKELANDWFYNYFRPKCLHDVESLQNSYQYELCKRLSRNDLNHDPLPQCHSIAAFFNSTSYDEEHNWFNRFALPYVYASKDSSASVAQMEEMALRQLGGITVNPTTQQEDDSSTPIPPPMVWFGITERMPESICLLHYTFQLDYTSRTPMHRFQECRPSHWFTPHERQVLHEREWMDYPIHRAAHAIMDIRMDQMCANVRNMSVRPRHIPDHCCREEGEESP